MNLSFKTLCQFKTIISKIIKKIPLSKCYKDFVELFTFLMLTKVTIAEVVLTWRHYIDIKSIC